MHSWGENCAFAQYHSTTWNLILARLQHSVCNVVFTSHGPFTAWNASGLCICMVAQLPAHWNKHLLFAKFFLGGTITVDRKFSIGGLCLCSGGLIFRILMKTPPICIASNFSLGALELCLRLRHGIPPWRRDWREHWLIEYFYYYRMPRNDRNRKSGLKTYLGFSCLILRTCLVFRRCSTE